MVVTIVIIGITIFMSNAAWKDSNKMNKWVFSAYLVEREKSYYRFISSGFIHGDNIHLFVNMLTFYFFAPSVIHIFNQRTSSGTVLFLVLYFISIIGSEIPSYFKHKDNPYYKSLGASGGISGIVFSSILYRPDATFTLFFMINLPAIVFGVLYIVYTFYAGKKGGDKINHSAHFWGAVIGVAFTLMIDPSVIDIFLERIQFVSLF